MEAIITSEPEKLPETVRGLLVETQPLPPGTVFFEQRFTAVALMGRLVWGLGLLVVGVLLVPISLMMIFAPHQIVTVYSNHDPEWWLAGFGAVMALAGWLMVASVPACLALGRQQKAGRQTRYGVFLVPEAIVWRSYADTTVIPRETLLGVDGLKVRFTSKTGEKSYTLPADWVGVTPAEVERAVRAWTQPEKPPMLPPVRPAVAG